MHAVSEGADNDLKMKLGSSVGNHKHFECWTRGFTIHHYAGKVNYEATGFCDRNRDIFFNDLIELMQSSENAFIRNLFPDVVNNSSKSRPTTAGAKIKSQANKLVEALMKCTPHYIRCIKPNETKKPHDWEGKRCKHQVEYLGLKENIRVRRAGFAYRRPFEKFMKRYSITCQQTWPKWRGDSVTGVRTILSSVNMDPGEYQLGTTKVFIKTPESLFLLEELRERKYDHFARIIQKAFCRYFARKQHIRQKEQAAEVVFGKKERRRYSINRTFAGDYIGMDQQPALKTLVGKREKIDFAESVIKYDRRFQPSKRDLVLAGKNLYLLGREKVKKGPKKGQIIEVIKRKIPISDIRQLSTSTKQDDILVIHVNNDYDTLLESAFKTELLSILNKKMKELHNKTLLVNFSDNMEVAVKKEGWSGGGVRQIKVLQGNGDATIIKIAGKVLQVMIGPGLPSTTKPSGRVADNETLQTARSVIKVVQGNSQQNRSFPAPPPSSSSFPAPPPSSSFSVPQTRNNVPVVRNNRNSRAPMAPPPTAPPPPNQPVLNWSQNSSASSSVSGVTSQSGGSNKRNDYLGTPDAGVAGAARASIRNVKGPAPRGPPKPRTAPKPPPAVARGKAIYAYEAQDVDELTIKVGEVIEIITEDPSGWWQGRLNGKQGLFPGNYVQKI